MTEAQQVFHTLNRHNSTRAERQAAWRIFEDERQQRVRRMLYQHPRPPSRRWCLGPDDHDPVVSNSGLRWTYPSHRSLLHDEVEILFPEALVMFDTQCSDLHGRSRFVVDQWSHSNTLTLRLSVPQHVDGTDTLFHCTVWLPELLLWRRYCKSVKRSPMQNLRVGDVFRVTKTAIWIQYWDGSTCLKRWL